jgi:hypothetical protein
MSSSNTKLFQYALIVIATFLTCDVGTVRAQTSQPPTATTTAGGGGTVSPANKRYLVYGAPWTYQPFATFASAVDEAVNDGFNAVRLHVPWMDTQLRNGVYDFSALDREVAYVVSTKHLQVAFMIDLTRPSSDRRDAVLSPDDVMQGPAGGYCGRIEWNVASASQLFVNQLSFASDNFIQKANAFIRTIVARYHTLYPNSILYVTTGTALMMEVAYHPGALYDYSPVAISKFRQWIHAKYHSIDSLNLAWRTNFSDFNSVTPPSDWYALWDDVRGMEWYNFRHYMMKQAVTSFAATVHGISSSLRYGIQFGSTFDDASDVEATTDFPDLIADADIVQNDDAPAYNHSYSMDLLRANSPNKWIANEIDGPTVSSNPDVDYLLQATQSFEHGATFVSVANWNQVDLANHRSLWSNIASLLSQSVTTGTASSSMTESAYDILKARSTASYQVTYNMLSDNGADWVDIIRKDDLYNTSAFNLALGKNATASSYVAAPFYAVDGRTDWLWIARDGTFPQWLMVDLGVPYNLGSIKTIFYAGELWKYDLQCSIDGSSWTTLTDNKAYGRWSQIMNDAVDATCRYVKIGVTGSTADWAAIRELEVYRTREPTNVALFRPATASSYCAPGSYAVNGRTNDYWCAHDGTFPQWLMVDLGDLYTISHVKTTFYANELWKYNLQCSVDGGGWTTLADNTTGLWSQIMNDPVEATCRYVKIVVTGSAADWAAIREFEVYGK